MVMTEEEKREKLLKLRYDSHKTDAMIFFTGGVTFYATGFILLFNESARKSFLPLLPFSLALLLFFCAYTGYKDICEYQAKLEKMYAPKEKIKKRAKKRMKGRALKKGEAVKR